MEKPAELCPVIAVRVLFVSPEQNITVRLGLPFTPDEFPDESWCPYQIEGLGKGRIRHVVGIDACQSIWLALQTIGATLYASEEYRSGQLRLSEDSTFGDLCFPVPENLRDLLPPPPERPPGNIPPAI